MLFPLSIPPGIYRNGTEYQAKGRYHDSNLVRFFEGTIRPIGGWRKKTASPVNGAARAIIAWTDNSLATHGAIGTHSNLYAMARDGTLSDITPFRAAGTLTNPFSTTNGSTSVSVAHTAHGLGVGDRADFSGGSAVGGLTIAGEYTVTTVTDANHYTITAGAHATSTVSGGGSSVTYGYPIRPGRADAEAGGGYGQDAYGTGSYGTPRSDGMLIQDASVWSLDNWGEDLVGCMADDGALYQWSLDDTARAAIIASAPNARALVVTQERILMALGAEGNPRRVKWSDQEDNTDWIPTTTNQAGDFDLQTQGRLMCGRALRGVTLLFTDLDIFGATYTGDTLVYAFAKLGDACGVISQNAAAVLDSRAAWMGASGFWLYNGYVQPLPCEVSDYVFSDINLQQVSKVTCWVDSAFAEVWWFYPSASSTEIDRYVTWNYRDDDWAIGTLTRLAGVDRGAMIYPLLLGADGYVYEHEVGFDYDGASPYVESGPIELGNGDAVLYATQLIPDEKTAGEVTATFKAKFYPNGPQSCFGPYTLNSPTDVRFAARQVRVRYTGAAPDDWRVGVPRLDVTAGGKR